MPEKQQCIGYIMFTIMGIRKFPTRRLTSPTLSSTPPYLSYSDCIYMGILRTPFPSFTTRTGIISSGFTILANSIFRNVILEMKMYLRRPGYALFESTKRFLQAQGIFGASTVVLFVAAPINAVLYNRKMTS